MKNEYIQQISSLLEDSLPRLINLANKELPYTRTLESLAEEIYHIKIHPRKKELVLESDIRAAVTRVTGVDVDVKNRKTYLATAKHLYCFLCKRYTTMSHRTISEHTKRKDHTSSISSVKRFKNLLKSKDEMALSMYKQAEDYLKTLK